MPDTACPCVLERVDTVALWLLGGASNFFTGLAWGAATWSAWVTRLEPGFGL